MNERTNLQKKECMEGGREWRMEEWTDGSVDQSVNQSINQSINHSINQSMELATDMDKNKEAKRQYCTGLD